ncbi:MAG TPA: ATP-dependent DNA helicase RecG [Chthonomonas sp.]|uniref:ATP-dependent DNA helicase RecG n=1 Tax=Chthonomonas sp. TaxID=2282153 RepID=UPI002B4B294F|nr:ATP-dependent DNA helicase RecG [Chthonomonas sp.]HLI47435.1 ATP-dependent DNA helicase RecG [Chthonomonas sp.]
MPEKPTVPLTLDTPLQYVKGVGPHIAQRLAKLNLQKVNDLLHHYPRRWEDRTLFAHAAQLRGGEFVTLCGLPLSVSTTHPRPGLSLTKALLDDQGAAIALVWFNQPYMEQVFRKLIMAKQPVVVYGQTKRSGWIIEIQNPEWEPLDEAGDSLSSGRITPVYPATEGLTQARLRRLTDHVLRECLPLIEEPLPLELRQKHGLMGLREALQNIHYPTSFEALDAARRRLVFEEFFLMQLYLALQRHKLHANSQGIRFHISLEELHQSLQAILPFPLTKAQQRAIHDIAADMSSGRLMNRLVQGDVGSGKTMVALAAILMAVQNGYQAALMAPTEILAQQHAIVLRRLLEPLQLRVELAIGSLSKREKQEVYERLRTGESLIAVGTHALIQEDVGFARLGLAIIDEQHRFGVLQRRALSRKGEQPHVLVMTATPIPRTLTLTLYGDLDVSVLDELPPGRKPITTHWRSRSKREQVYAAAERLLVEGRQAYIVCPLIEESEKLEAQSAAQLHAYIANKVYPHRRVGLLHGQMPPSEKEQVMLQFKAHELDVLVSTTVIEVGIDVPNASIIIIEDADRFGLAQLHQLRGRVGRGEYPSYCILLADPKTPEGRARMEIMVKTCDGFRIADEDLRLRGPGEFLGTRQSGLPDLHIADLLADRDVLVETRNAALDLVQQDPTLSYPQHRALREALQRMHSHLELASVS